MPSGPKVMIDPKLFGAVQAALKGLRFGTLELVVHEGKLVRIERTERIRIASDDPNGPSGTSGGPTIANHR